METGSRGRLQTFRSPEHSHSDAQSNPNSGLSTAFPRLDLALVQLPPFSLSDSPRDSSPQPPPYVASPDNRDWVPHMGSPKGPNPKRSMPSPASTAFAPATPKRVFVPRMQVDGEWEQTEETADFPTPLREWAEETAGERSQEMPPLSEHFHPSQFDPFQQQPTSDKLRPNHDKDHNKDQEEGHDEHPDHWGTGQDHNGPNQGPDWEAATPHTPHPPKPPKTKTGEQNGRTGCKPVSSSYILNNASWLAGCKCWMCR